MIDSTLLAFAYAFLGLAVLALAVAVAGIVVVARERSARPATVAAARPARGDLTRAA